MNRSFLLPPLSVEELLELQRLLRAQRTPAGLYRRCNLIWQLAAGFNLTEASEIAGLHYTNAHEWVKRFQRSGLSGLQDLPRPGRPKIYGQDPETLVMQTATSRPPDLGLGFTTWSLSKLEAHLRRHSPLKSLSRETIRRILAHHGLRFLTGQTWCESNDPDFEVKKNAIIELYRHPPKRGVVVCFDEFGPLQTIPRGGQAWGKQPARRPDRYRRNGTLQWFGAFCPTNGQSIGQGSGNKNTNSCKRFWGEKMLSFWSRGSIHLIMDNLSAHKKALRILPYNLRRRIKVYWLPTNSSWLNLIESYFATLQKTGLNNTNYKTPEEIDHGLQKGVQYLNLNPKPYV